MRKKALRVCPVCGKDLIISQLKCTDCDMEYSGDFQLPLFSQLNDREIEFILEFLKYEGNISKIQKESGRSYANIKSTLNEINVKLGSTQEKGDTVNVEILSNQKSVGIIKVIQDKLLECNGKSKMQMLKGAPLDIWLSSSGEGIENSGYPALICEWHILEAIVNKANQLGGTMYRGDSAAQNGERIGSEGLPLDTIDAFISLEFYGGSVGATTLRRSTYYAAILAWAGIVENHRSKGKGGYITVNPEYRC